MGWKDLLLTFDGGRAGDKRLETAISVARMFEAHLTGLVVVVEPEVPGYVMAQVPTGAWDAHLQEVRRHANMLAERFQTAVGRAGLGVDSRIDSGVEPDISRIVSMHARHADLIILGQPDPEDPQPGERGLVSEVALGCGRPVLIVPYIGTGPTLGERIIVAWDGGREATRAINDALPLLKRSEKVIVLAVNPSDKPGRYGKVAGADISLHLARHGVKVEVQSLEVRDLGVGDALLSRLADEGADVLVMGAYGHSRLSETLLGGVTRQILESMTVPVLMSH